MSLDALRWAFSLAGISPVEKLVLLALADRWNHDTRQCWPSLTDIARRCCLAERTVRRALRTLEDRRLVSTTHRVGETGVFTSSVYFLAVSLPGQTDPIPGQPDPGVTVSPYGVTVSAESEVESPREPKTSSSPPVPRVNGFDSGAAFASFWAGYPRRNGKRVGRADALRAYKRIVTSEEKATQVSTALENYAAHCGDLPKDPHRWLAADRWREWLAPDVIEPATTADHRVRLN